MRPTHSVLNRQFDGRTDKEVESFLLDPEQCNFVKVRKLDDGEWIGIYKLAYTWSVCTGIEVITSYKYRWCFQSREEAEYMFANLVDYDDPPHEDHRTTLVGHRWSVSTGALIKVKDENGIDRW